MSYDQFGNPIPDGQGSGNAGGYDQFGNPQQPNGSGSVTGSNSGQMPPGYTSGPPGSSGGLTASPGGQGYGGQGYGQQMNPYGQQPPSMQQYGYGNRPNQGGGYYEQQTPAGSFAAANQQWAGPAQGVGTQGSVMPWAQQAARYSQQSNPYLGGQTQQVGSAGSNPYMGQNPYLQQQVASAQKQAGQSFTDTVLPQFDRQAAQSGSFGNTGVDAARGRAIDSFGQNQANTANNAYMQDYAISQGLQENALNRNQQTNMANAGFNAGDLGRNLGGAYTGQQIGMQGMAGLLGGAQFDANLGQQGQMFNAGQANQTSQFNASQGNGLNMYNAGQGNQMLTQRRNLDQNQSQFDANLDRNIYNDNQGWMRQGQQDQLGLYDRVFGWNQGGVGNAGQIQNTPMNYWQPFMNGSDQAGQNGGTNSNNSTMQGNPYLGFLGGAQFGNGLYNYWNQGGG